MIKLTRSQIKFAILREEFRLENEVMFNNACVKLCEKNEKNKKNKNKNNKDEKNNKIMNDFFKLFNVDEKSKKRINVKFDICKDINYFRLRDALRIGVKDKYLLDEFVDLENNTIGAIYTSDNIMGFKFFIETYEAICNKKCKYYFNKFYEQNEK